jgi:hypothetical protein
MPSLMTCSRDSLPLQFPSDAAQQSIDYPLLASRRAARQDIAQRYDAQSALDRDARYFLARLWLGVQRLARGERNVKLRQRRRRPLDSSEFFASRWLRGI